MPVFREKLVVIAPKEITAIRTAGDIRGMTVIAFAAGCSYRRTLEEWLARSKVTPEACLGIWVLSRDRRLRRCGFWNSSGTSFGR
jgi:hypothetical protein